MKKVGLTARFHASTKSVYVFVSFKSNVKKTSMPKLHKCCIMPSFCRDHKHVRDSPRCLNVTRYSLQLPPGACPNGMSYLLSKTSQADKTRDQERDRDQTGSHGLNKDQGPQTEATTESQSVDPDRARQV